ncbi:MAG: polysaccharide deacetylase family protein [Anaerolineae bacterium]|jgi:peptidoglycan/xylan/chitin deacetylase (PgdA/CDA1 family)|nr:polysaccharide deacetylase family protein [Anaerolineae bacterium]
MHRRPTLTLIVLSTLLVLLTTTALVACAETSAPPRATYAPPFCPNPARIPRPVAPAEKVSLPILMYHHITRLPPNANATWRTLTVTPEAFEAQVKWLADNGYHAIYFSDLVAYFRDGVSLPEKPIILTFDDGWTDDYTVVYPILRKYCMVGTFFPPVAWVNRSNGSKVITWSMIEEMSRGGMEFGSHTINHYLLNEQTAQRITEELVGSKAALEQHVVLPVVALAYPGGGHNPLVVSLAPKAGYGAAVGVKAGVEQAHSDLFLLHRITIPYSDDLKAFERRITPKSAPNAPVPPASIKRP